MREVPSAEREARGPTRAPRALLLLRKCQQEAESWLARFEPLLSHRTPRRPSDCRRLLRRIPELRAEGEDVLVRVQMQATPAEAPLAATLRDALRELDALEQEYQDRLGMLAAGSPAGRVDLARLRAKLAEAAARREVEAWDGADATRARLKRPSPRQLGKSRKRACDWLVRFEPMLADLDGMSAEDCRRSLQQLPALRADGQVALARLEQQALPTEAPLLATVREALRELNNLEPDYRRRLGALAPGDPAAEVDLEPLRARLAEAAARRDVEALAGARPGTPLRLRLTIAPGTWCSHERIELEGRELTVRRRVWLGSSVRTYQLAPGSRARVAGSAIGIEGDVTNDVVLEDEEGNEIRFASGRPYREQKRLVARLNEYLEALRV